ncbi:MAG: polyhydroxyalkanoate depolymerase [Granulosicoccus sp.]
MLYSWYDSTLRSASAMRQSAELTRSLLSTMNPSGGHWPLHRSMTSNLEFIEFVTKPFYKPDFEISSVTIDGDHVAVAEDVVMHKPFCELRSFKRTGAKATQEKVLIVAPMSGHYATLVRETIQRMLEHYDVYVTDWIDAAQVPLGEGCFDLDDYVDYCREFMQLLGPDLHVLSVCQPGPPVLAAIALMSEDDDPCTPSSMVFFGSPIDPRINPTEPNRLAQMHSLQKFENNAICKVPGSRPGAGRLVYPGFLQLSAFVNMNPDRHRKAYAKYYSNLMSSKTEAASSHEKFYSNYNAVMDMTAEFYLQTIDRVFHKAEIANNTMVHRGRLVNPAAITKTRLMTIEGEKDDVTGQGQTRAAIELCSGLPSNHRLHHLQAGAGHYGVFSGRLWRNEIAPVLVEYLKS